jgi:hypothetical protein
MAVVVSFIRPKGVGSIDAPGIGDIRIREDITPPGTTTATAQDGEVVIVGNAEATMVAVAHGTTPDAAAPASTNATSAGCPVAAGAVSDPFVPATGSKINIKAVS